MPTDKKVARIQDFDPVVRSSRFSAANTICVPESQTSVEAYLKIMEEDYEEGLRIGRVNGTDLLDCMRQVYVGDATATMYDEPVVLNLLKDEFYDQGYCGKTGGKCLSANGSLSFDLRRGERRRRWGRRSDHGGDELPEAGTPVQQCTCPELSEDGTKCLNPDQNTFAPFPAGELVTTGEIFNDLGYALAFPRDSKHLITWP